MKCGMLDFNVLATWSMPAAWVASGQAFLKCNAKVMILFRFRKFFFLHWFYIDFFSQRFNQ